MKPFGVELEEASIVLVGSLNPAIFHPEWLFRYGLVSKDDLDASEVTIVHPDVSQFSLNWLKFHVQRDKLIAKTNDPSSYAPLKDLMISVLKILEHTPINKMGMNLHLTYSVDSEDLWHVIGDNLAPKAYWDMLPHAGLLRMDIHSPRPDDLEGYLKFFVNSEKNDYFGVMFKVNSHVDLRYTKDEKEYIQDAPAILADYWDGTIAFARESCENVLMKAIK